MKPLLPGGRDGGTVEVNKEDDNRLQVFFEEKPDEDKRTELKKGGFKWSPTAGAWQRQLNGNAFYAANHISCIQPLTGERPTDLQRAHIRAEKAKEQAEQQPSITEPDSFLTGETVQTPRGSFRLSSMSKLFDFSKYRRMVYSAPYVVIKLVIECERIQN